MLALPWSFDFFFFFFSDYLFSQIFLYSVHGIYPLCSYCLVCNVVVLRPVQNVPCAL